MTVRPSSLDRNDVPVEGDLRLPKPPGMIRQFWYRHPRWTDALIAASYGVPTTLLHIGPLFGEEFSPGEIVPFGFALDLFGTLLLLPTIISAVIGITQAQWAMDISPYMFATAGTGIFSPGGPLSQGENLLVVLAWVAVSLVGGALLLKRRDA